MYSQEAVETPEEMADTAFNDAIHARVSRSVFSGGPLWKGVDYLGGNIKYGTLILLLSTVFNVS